MSLPSISFSGNLVADPELRFTPSGHAVARIRVACGERTLDRQTNEWKDGDSCFLDVEVWRGGAENLAESATRGTKVTVTGKLRQRSYETREGEKRTVYEVKEAVVGISLENQHAKVTKSTNAQAPVQGTTATRPQAATTQTAAPEPAPVSTGAPLDEPPF